MYSLNQRQGETLVKLARRSVECSFSGQKPEIPEEEWLNEARGLFVTINTYPEDELRGCIGFPIPMYPLKKSVMEAATAAAFNDPRFPPLKKEELDRVIFEVSVLTTPEELKSKNENELLEMITPHKDGLILEYMGRKGLFLPQVWEHLPKKEDFLSNLCLKAGIPDTECWKKEGVKVYRFRAQVFKEEIPNGRVIEINP